MQSYKSTIEKQTKIIEDLRNQLEKERLERENQDKIIESLKSRTTETFYDIKVKSAVNFGKIQTVYIVIDLFKDEIEKLEAELNKKNLNVK